jgi:hypothetical protein
MFESCANDQSPSILVASSRVRPCSVPSCLPPAWVRLDLSASCSSFFFLRNPLFSTPRSCVLDRVRSHHATLHQPIFVATLLSIQNLNTRETTSQTIKFAHLDSILFSMQAGIGACRVSEKSHQSIHRTHVLVWKIAHVVRFSDSSW